MKSSARRGPSFLRQSHVELVECLYTACDSVQCAMLSLSL